MFTFFVLAVAVVRSDLWKPPFKESSPSSPCTLYAVLNYSYIIFPLTLGSTFYCISYLTRISGYHDLVVSQTGDWDWTTVVFVLVNLFFMLTQLPPYASTIGLCLPSRPYHYSQQPRRRSFKTMNICLVTKGTNFQTVLNSVEPWSRLREDKRIRFHVVVDGPDRGAAYIRALPSFVQVFEVEAAFTTKRARYKARALEYYRRQVALTQDDWVFHLDEESMIDQHTVQTCVDFIERGAEDIAMTTIFYNGANHWKNAFLSVAEVMRIAEDFGRFQLPIRLFRRPLLGWMHGSGILINGAVENRVQWETACVAEDFWFAYNAAALGYTFGWLHTVIREQPPETVGDFFRQRRRWYTGILSVRSFIVRFALVTSVGGAFGLFVSPICTLLVTGPQIPHWVFRWIMLSTATDTHILAVASVIQDMNSPWVSWPTVVGNVIRTVALAPFVHLAQAAALLSCLVRPAVGFEVISKS